MTDLIARLRRDGSDWCIEAAGEIERLQNIVEIMRGRAANLASLLQGAAVDARNIQAASMPGFFQQLTPKQQAAALAYRGQENHGDPNAPTEVSRAAE